MNLDNYIKTILSGVKTWAQSTFAKKSDIKDMYYDNRTIITTKEVTVNGVTGTWGSIKVADTIDFDINKVTHMSRYGNDGLYFTNSEVFLERYEEDAVEIGAYFDGDGQVYYIATYLPTQKAADLLFGDSYNNPFSPGLYMWMSMDEGEPCSVAYSFTYETGDFRAIDPKYIPEIPLATGLKAGAVHPWIKAEYGQNVWMHPETGELFTNENTYTYILPVANYSTLGGVKPVAKTSTMTSSVGVDANGRLYADASGVGKSTTGTTYTINGVPIIADSGAEIFNDYMNNRASGKYSHAEGGSTEASGDYSHAEGYNTTASGIRSHAEGYDATASGESSHAEGYHTIASGEKSHAEGFYTTALSAFQHAQGKYNIDDTENKYAHIVGNGKTSTTKSNAHTLDWAGNAWFQGDIYVGSTSGKNKDDGSKKIATIDDIETAIDAIPSAQADWEEIDETSATYIKNKPKIGMDYIVLSDSNSGFNYAISISNGNLVASQIYELDYIKIITMPNKLDYIEGEPIDLTGLSLNVVYKNGDEKSVTNYDINVDYSSSSINIIYKEYGSSIGAEIQINVTPFDPSVVLVDFDYTSNSDGTYTITEWKGTYNGVSSTELIIPDNSLIVL